MPTIEERIERMRSLPLTDRVRKALQQLLEKEEVNKEQLGLSEQELDKLLDHGFVERGYKLGPTLDADDIITFYHVDSDYVSVVKNILDASSKIDIPRLVEIEELLLQSDITGEEIESLVEEARSLGWNYDVDLEDGRVTSFTKSQLYNPKFCEKCGRTTEHSKYGYCLTCSNPAVDAINKRIAQYREWTGDEDWQYDASTYWQKAWEMMYQMVIAGRAVSEIALEFDTSENNVKSRIRQYCKSNNLETPFRKTKKRERKPNGLFCLACSRPLFGNQKKWCDNADCGGWNDLHPRLVRQCSICKIIDATYVGSGYETICQGCTNSPEEAKRRAGEWIARERASAEETKKMRESAYEEVIREVSRECNENVFFGYLKIDFNRCIITPVGKKPDDMFEICHDIQKVWELCKPMWKSDILKSLGLPEISPAACPVFTPFLSGPNRVSCFLAPVEDWELSVDMYHWWFSIQGDMVTFLTMKFSDWLRRQYIENEKDIEETAKDAKATVYQIEYALNELSIPLRTKGSRR